MKIPEFNSLQLNTTDAAHFSFGKSVQLSQNLSSFDSVSGVQRVSEETNTASVNTQQNPKKASFRDFLLQAMEDVNTQQNNVSALQEKLITNPDEVDIHDVTIAMSKARMSLNLAQTVIDRLVSDWNEITTTR